VKEEINLRVANQAGELIDRECDCQFLKDFNPWSNLRVSGEFLSISNVSVSKSVIRIVQKRLTAVK
jgi:hypothetical protein